MVLILSRPAAAKPLSADDITTLLGSVSQKRVAALIEEKGITFEPTAAVQRKLRDAGAGDDVIGAVERAAAAAGGQREADQRGQLPPLRRRRPLLQRGAVGGVLGRQGTVRLVVPLQLGQAGA